MTRSWNPASPAGGGLDIPYSPAAVSDGYVHVAGVISSDASGEIIADDFREPGRAHVRRTWFRRFKSAGWSAADVVHMTTYLTDRGDFDAFNDAFEETFSDPYPARVTILAQLAGGRALDRGHGRRRPPMLNLQVIAPVRRVEVELGTAGTSGWGSHADA